MKCVARLFDRVFAVASMFAPIWLVWAYAYIDAYYARGTWWFWPFVITACVAYIPAVVWACVLWYVAIEYFTKKD